MNARYSLLLATALAACVDHPVHPAAEDSPERVSDAPMATPASRPTPVWLDAAGHLGDQLRDAANAANAPDARTDSPAWEAFYAPDAVHHVTIELSEPAWDAIEEDGRTWVPAYVTIDDVPFPGAGVRRKGSTTWQGMTQKPSFKIKLHAFGDGPRLAGLERVTLNNMVSDPSQARENIALQLWRKLGVEATRSSWATVTVNGDPYGLYSNIEPLDDEWLQRRYVAYKGDLWEANDDADFTEEGLAWWELSEGTGESGALEALAAVLEEGVDDFEADVGPYLDVEQFLRYWAACLVTGSADGYPFHLNDAYIYADPGDAGRIDFLPWGMDEAWADNFSPWTEGALAEACRDDEACDARRVEVLDEMLGAIDAIDVAGIVAESFATSAPFLADDPRRPFTAAEVDLARADLTQRIAGWSDRIRAEAK